MSRFIISIDPPQIEDVAQEMYDSFRFQGLTLLSSFYEQACYLPNCNIELVHTSDELKEGNRPKDTHPVFLMEWKQRNEALLTPEIPCIMDNYGNGPDFSLVGYVTDKEILKVINDYFLHNLVEFRVETSDNFYYVILNTNKKYTLESLSELFKSCSNETLIFEDDFDAIKEVFDNHQMKLV